MPNGNIKQQGETSIKHNIVNQVNKKLKSVQEGTDRAKAPYLMGQLLSRTVKSKKTSGNSLRKEVTNHREALLWW